MKSNWIIVGASVIGKGHIERNIPCQDAHKHEMLNENWGIAILADGAGSCDNSHIGSGFIVEKGSQLFTSLVEKRGWIKKSKLPTDKTWRKWAVHTLTEIKKQLTQFSKEEKFELNTLSSTIIVLIFSPKGLLSAHIGDGRAGYCDTTNSWKSAITPFSGEQVGTTVFLTTEYVWESPELYIETRVIYSNIKAFTLLSDGCETGCYECYLKKPDKEEYFDPNNPYDNFFNPNVIALLNMEKEKILRNEMNRKWMDFLENGNEIFAKETDDKTMILAVLKNS